MHGRFALSHGRVLASGNRTLVAEVRVRADELASAAINRVPVAFVLVVDTSGSMAGQKIVDARRSALAMLDQMHADDYIAVVRFNTDARVVVPLLPVHQARGIAEAEVGRLQATGNTDIANALRSAHQLLASVGGDRARRIVLVTDGRDTSGAPRDTASGVAQRASASGVTCSALGIGADYDDAYLSNLADYGRGNYEFLANTSALHRFLSRELQETKKTTVQNVVAEMDLPTRARVRGAYGANWDMTSRGARLQLGSLFSGDERRALLEIEVDAGPAGSWFSFGGSIAWSPVGREPIRRTIPALRFEAVGDASAVEESRDPSIIVAVMSVRASEREREAARAFERGDRHHALQLNQQNRDELAAAAATASGEDASRLRAQKKAYEKDRDVYTTQPASPEPARAIGAREHGNLARDLAY
jgi:Ca-activated chloride channel family protein